MIERAVNSTMISLRIIEKVIHGRDIDGNPDHSGWEMRCGEVTVPVLVHVEGYSVRFTGVFPAVSEEVRMASSVDLFHDDEMFWSRVINHTGHEGFKLDCTWTVADSLQAA